MNYSLKKIKSRLEEEGMVVSKTSLCLLIKTYQTMGFIADYQPTCPPKKLRDNHYWFINDCMVKANLHRKLMEAFPELSGSVKQARWELGWVAKKSLAMSCQEIPVPQSPGHLNCQPWGQEKRLLRCQKQIDGGDLDFEDVICTDECTIQLEYHRKFCFRKAGQLVRYRVTYGLGIVLPRWFSQPYPLLMSWNLGFCHYWTLLILKAIDIYMQDKDSKHTSQYAQWWFEEKGVNWWKTPASSPDLNPIELFWHALKEYTRKEFKPRNLSELKAGYQKVLELTDCRHLCKVHWTFGKSYYRVGRLYM